MLIAENGLSGDRPEVLCKLGISWHRSLAVADERSTMWDTCLDKVRMADSSDLICLSVLGL